MDEARMTKINFNVNEKREEKYIIPDFDFWKM
jgi:hypothetical protein